MSRRPHPILMIVGTAFSGSTLLSFLLRTHAEIVSTGELTGPIPGLVGRDYLCSCGATLSECRFWADVFRLLRSRGVPFGPDEWNTRLEFGSGPLSRLILGRSLRVRRLDRWRDDLAWRLPGIGPAVRAVAERNVALIAALRAVSGRQVVADASKDPRRYAYLRRFPELDPFVLHLVRDAPGYVNSHRRNLNAGLGSGLSSWLRMGRQVERLFRDVAPARRLRLRYEELCSDPEGQLDRVARFLALPGFPQGLAFRDGDHHILGGRMRLDTHAEIRLDESWRRDLTSQEKARIAARAEPLRRRLGYEN